MAEPQFSSNFNPQQFQGEQGSPQSGGRSHRWVVWLIVLFILILIGGAGYWYREQIYTWLGIAPMPSVTPLPEPGGAEDQSDQGGNQVAGDIAKQGALKQFASYDELKDFITEQSNSYARGMYVMDAMPMMNDSVAIRQDSMGFGGKGAGEATAPSSEAGQSAQDYSTTNIQVAGVDEADIIKNDGQYIYAVSKKSLYIIDAYPASEATVLAKIEFTSTPQDIFISGDRLAVFGYNDQIYTAKKYPTDLRRSQYTFFKVFDISDKQNPKQVRDLDFEGSYFDSRLVGNWVYFITTSYYVGDEVPVPLLLSEGRVVSDETMPVYYFDAPYSNFNFTTVSAINLSDSSDVNSEVYLMDYGQNLYVSQNNIYLTYTKQLNQYTVQLEVMKEIMLPRLPVKDQQLIAQIEAVDDKILNKDEKLQKISQIVERYIYGLTESEQESFRDEIEKAYAQKLSELADQLERTVIHKIAFQSGDFHYQQQGEVKGQVLNQFSMDERDGYFRIATTRSQMWTGIEEADTQSYSNLYVLDKDLKVTGSVEKLAPGERIYSVRFIGSRAYLVTFKQVDPLFAVDLSDPANPKVLGQLKLPGFSSYLHPYDENYLIGIGRDADENGRTRGLKLSLFNVTDPANITEVDSYLAGGTGSDSEALFDHKAFLFDKNKQLLVIPATLREQTSTYGQRVTFRGALVFKLDTTGFTLRKQIDHWDGRVDSEMQDYWYGHIYYDNTIKRSLYMDDMLYTFSNNFLKAHDLANLDLVKELPLEKSSNEDFIIVN